MNERSSSGIEHRQLRGITIRNIIVALISTVSIVVSIMTTYYQLRENLKDLKDQQESQSRINDIRLKLLEDHVAILQQEIDGIKITTNYKTNFK